MRVLTRVNIKTESSRAYKILVFFLLCRHVINIYELSTSLLGFFPSTVRIYKLKYTLGILFLTSVLITVFSFIFNIKIYHSILFRPWNFVWNFKFHVLFLFMTLTFRFSTSKLFSMSRFSPHFYLWRQNFDF